jgi:hypothetical protein
MINQVYCTLGVMCTVPFYKSEGDYILWGKKCFSMYRHGMCFRASSVFILSILFWFPQRTHYFLRVFRFLFMEHKQDYSWHLWKMLKFAFKEVSTKNSEPTYWTILFVMLNTYFIYKVAGKKSRRAI